MAATRTTLPCCASAAFDDNNSTMTMHFLFLDASDNQQVGLLLAAVAAAV